MPWILGPAPKCNLPDPDTARNDGAHSDDIYCCDDRYCNRWWVLTRSTDYGILRWVWKELNDDMIRGFSPEHAEKVLAAIAALQRKKD